jgi:LysR family transcriptional regulator for bpeEF and oprC
MCHGVFVMNQLLAMRVFVRIAEAGTFVKAANSLNIPKPTVTKLIQSLETHLGVKLLRRTTRRVTVTPEGALYHEHATRLITELEEMDRLVAGVRAQPKGLLRIDIGSSLANIILIPSLPDFRQRYPDIQLHVGVSDRAVDLISDGVDCVIRGGLLADSSLVARRIADLKYVTCASPSYLKSHGAPLHPKDLEQGHHLVGYFSSLTSRPFPLFFEMGKEKLIIPTDTAFSVNESTAHMTALLQGHGVGQTFAFMAQAHMKRGTLVSVLDNWRRPSHPIQLVYPENRHLSAKLRVFVDWAVEVFAAFDVDRHAERSLNLQRRKAVAARRTRARRLASIHR